MIRKNPHSVGWHLVLYLWSAKGKETGLAKAKSFEIRKNNQTVYFDEFPSIKLSIDSKTEIIEAAVKAVEVSKEIEYEEDEYEEEYEESEEELAEDLYELFLEEIDEAVEEEDLELAEEMYKSLLEIIIEEDPELFTEITGILPEPPELSTRHEDYDFYSAKYGYVVGEKVWGTFDNPIDISSSDKEAFKSLLDQYLKGPILEAFYNTYEGEDLYLLRITYDSGKRSGKKIIPLHTGYGESRTQVSTEKGMIKLIDQAIKGFGNELQKYLSISANKKIQITGFTMENITDIIEDEE